MKNKVLAIVNDKVLREVIDDFLKIEEYEIKTYQNGVDVFGILETFTADVIFLDIVSSGVSEFALCEQLKKSIKFSEIPIIFLIREKNKTLIEMIFRVGGVDYLLKPFHLNKLIEIIKKWRDK